MKLAELTFTCESIGCHRKELLSRQHIKRSLHLSDIETELQLPLIKHSPCNTHLSKRSEDHMWKGGHHYLSNGIPTEVKTSGTTC